ncbi:hypothetical protein O181_064926 [Austropuccinia psidii MF-1]|uniref:Uncharacterized protein n=1 Tax=Austropuccinia psidii MF-1 TaxID=1389203 RepID=A0A9Q3EMZ9_9BASI|nr:hypothetical protein [Austropuccinia psidii MF-1]
MIPPHFRDFGVPRDYYLQRESTISRNRGLERREAEVVQSHKTWKNEPSHTFQNGFQQKTSRNGLNRTLLSNPSNLQRTSPMENGRQEIQPRVPLERTCRKYSEYFSQRDILQRTYHRREIEPEITYSDSFRLKRSGNPTRLPSCFTPLRHQQISDQESPYFSIPGRIQERKRIIGQEKYFFQPEAERVRSYSPEIVGPAKRSTKKQQTVVINSN